MIIPMMFGKKVKIIMLLNKGDDIDSDFEIKEKQRDN
jgi:hypothetical protein